jgi:hypothetical protein
MADEWDQFPDAPGLSVGAGGDPWAQFPDAAPDPQKEAEDQVRREMAMKPEEYEAHVREKVRKGGTYRPQPTRWNLTTDQVTDPIGVSDEITGAGAFVRGLVRSGGSLDEAGKAYTEAAERIRAERRVAREDNTAAPEIIGGLATAGPGKVFQMAPNFLARVGQSAKAGAQFGAAAGFAQGEGGVTNRLLEAGRQAAVGAALGPAITEVAAPAIGAVARATKAGGSAFRNAVQALRGQQANVDARYARALAQQNMTPRQALRQIDDAAASSRFGKTQLDSQFAPADLGPVTRDLADTSALVSSEARGISGDFLAERARGQYGRVNDYLRRSLQVSRDNFAKKQAGLVDEQKTLSNQAYKQAYADKTEYDVGQVLFNRQFDDDAAAGPLRSALQKARSLFVDPFRGPGYQARLTTERFDAGKRALDDMIGSAKRDGRGNEVRLLTGLKNDLLAVVDNPQSGNPAYKAARDVYSSRAELLDALEAGRTFMRGDSEVTGSAYKALSTGEKRMFRLGIAQQVRRDLGSKRMGTDMVSYFDKPNVRDVLGEIMSPAQARKFYQTVELEQAMAATNNAVRGNSKTAQRQQNVLDFSLGVRLGRAIKDQGLYNALTNEVFNGITKAFAMREGDAVALTKMLFETDRAAQQATLQRLQQTYGRRIGPIVNRAQRIAQQRVANARRMLAGIAGEQSDVLMDR